MIETVPEPVFVTSQLDGLHDMLAVGGDNSGLLVFPAPSQEVLTHKPFVGKTMVTVQQVRAVKGNLAEVDIVETN